MERTYRIEFNEKYQEFRLDNYTHCANKNGWFIILDNCTDLEVQIYTCYVSRLNKRKLTKEYLLKCVSEIKIFTNNLIEHNLVIEKK